MVDNRGPRPRQSPGDDTPWPDPFIAAGVPDPEAERRAGMGRRRVSPFVPLAGGCLMIMAAFLAVGAMIAGVAGSVARGWDDDWDRHGGWDGPRFVTGSGTLAKETRRATGVREIVLNGSGTLYITQGQEELLEVEAEDNILPQIGTKINGDDLTIGDTSDFGRSFQATKPITYRLTVRELRSIKSNGSGRIEATKLTVDDLRLEVQGSGGVSLDQITADELKVTIQGSGRVTASGAASEQEITINSAGEYRGESLRSRETKVTTNGSGQADVWATERADLQINGSGEVALVGNPPRVDQRVRGSGTIRFGATPQPQAPSPQAPAPPQAPTPPQPPAAPRP